MQHFRPLIPKKNWIEAYTLATLLHYEKPEKVTKKLCGELLYSPTKWRKALEVLTYYRCVVDWKWVYAPDINLPDMVEEKDEWVALASFISKNIQCNYQSVKGLLGYWIGKEILKDSKELRYDNEEEYLLKLIIEIKKDEWWNKILTWETFVRKYSNLRDKFVKNIPKKITKDFWAINDIF